MIDPHVHLRDWNQKDKETLLHGLQVAVNCGINLVFDMPNTNPPLTSRDAILDRISDGQDACDHVKGRISYRVYAGLTSDEKQIESMVSVWNELFPLVIGLKLFAGHSTGKMGICDIKDQRRIFRKLAELDYEGVLAVHCEKEDLMKPGMWNPDDISSQSDARPCEAEIESIRDMITLAQETGFRGDLHICHISTRDGLELVKQARRNGMRITCGATAHHALLCRSDANSRSFAKMNPPLRSEQDRDAIFQGLLDGSIDWIESDHAPHTLDDKKNGMSGIPGFSGTLLLLDALVKAGCPKERVEDLVEGNIAETFGIEYVHRKINIHTLRKLSKDAADEYPYDGFVDIR